MILRLLTTFFLLGAPALAQAQGCGIFTSVTFANYGTACGGAFLQVPALKGSLDVPQCGVKMDLYAPTGCCNVYFSGWVLILGAQQLQVPILRTGCTLYASPDIALLYTNTQTSVVIPLPQDPALKGILVHWQAAVRYVGFYFGPDLSEGVLMKTV